MAAENASYIETLDYLRGQAKKAVHGLSAVELDRAPLPSDSNSPGVLLAHMAGSEGFWIHQVVGGLDAGRDRDAEFRSKGSSTAELEALLDRAGETTRRVLGSISPDELDQAVQARPGEPSVSRRSAVLHAIEHMAQHLGHLELTVQLLAARSEELRS